MINDLDLSIEKLFELEFGKPLPFELSFARPDKSFAPAKSTLDCYLYDIRENRELRTVEPMLQRLSDGTVTRKYPPARIQLSYCVTAWSPTTGTPPAEPIQEEHELLSKALRVFLKYPTLPSGALAGSLVGQEPPLPTTVILPDSAKSVNDFWTAVGGELRPSLDYKVTLALDYQTLGTGTMLTTQISLYSQYDVTRASDERIQIGGQVLDTAVPPNPVPNAWIRLDEVGQTEISDEQGRFVISNVTRGQHTLQVRAVGYQDATRIIQVPEPTGDYSVILQ